MYEYVRVLRISRVGTSSCSIHKPRNSLSYEFLFLMIRNIMGSYICFSKKVLRSMVKIAHHHRYTTEIKYITCCPK